MLAACLMLSALLRPSTSTAQSTNPTISYQATVSGLENTMVATVMARLYSDPAGLDLLWEEELEVTPLGGVISLDLGARTPLPIHQMHEAVFLSLAINDGEELRPFTKLSASPLALTVPDGAITKTKLGANYIESIAINGREINTRAGRLNLQTGKGILTSYDEATGAILLSASAVGKSGYGTLSLDTVTGLVVNGNTDLGGNASNPTIAFTGKSITDLDLSMFDLANAGTIDVTDELRLEDSTTLLSVNGSHGASGQVLISRGDTLSPTWNWPRTDWGQQGDNGTVAGTHYLGTNDDEPFEIHVDHNGTTTEGRGRVLRIEPTSESPNIIAGQSANMINEGIVGATISGGGSSSRYNWVYDNYGTISGGRANLAGYLAYIGGGEYNEATNTYSTVSGGYQNRATNSNSTIGGGYNNFANKTGSTIGGGEDNQAKGTGSTISGGLFNVLTKAATTIAGGQYNYIDNIGATISGGQMNTADGYYATIAGGHDNWASGETSVISGGQNNVANGHYSSIAGGRDLRLGTSSFGFNADATGSQTDLGTRSNIAYFGNVDLWIGNVDNTARSLRLYGPNTSHGYSSSYYTGFKAPTLTANIDYVMPSSQGAASSYLSNDGSGSLSWSVPTLSGDVTGPLTNTSVEFVGGETAANVALATAEVNAATSLNTAGTIVRRDASGNFSAGSITADLIGNASTVTDGVYTSGSYADPVWITSISASKIIGGLPAPDSVRISYTSLSAATALTATNADYATIAGSATTAGSANTANSATTATSATTAVSFTGSLSGDVTGTMGSTSVAAVGGQTAANIATGVQAANAATNSNTAGAIVERDASGNFDASRITVSNGLLASSGGVTITGGAFRLSTATVASANSGVAIPANVGVVRITSGASSNFSYTLPSGNEGQVLMIYNNHPSKRANNALCNISSGSMLTFVYINGDWHRPQ